MTNLKIVRAGKLHTYDTEPPKLTVRWDVTGRCPYHCSYCYERNHPKRKMEPTLENLVQGISSLKRLLPENKKIQFYLFGGEPTAHRDFLTFIKHLRESFPDAQLSCTSNLFRNLDFLKQLYAIDENFSYGVSVHFEFASEDALWEKISFLAKQKRKAAISLQFLPAARERVRALAKRIRETYPELSLNIQFLRSPESNFRKHYSDYTAEDYSWAQQLTPENAPTYFIDYIDEAQPGKIFRRKFLFMEAFHPELSDFYGARCTYPMQRLAITLNGELITNFCLPAFKENLYQDTSWPRAVAAIREPAVCTSHNCPCKGMRAAAKWFDPRFAPVYCGGEPALAHDAVDYEDVALPQ